MSVNSLYHVERLGAASMPNKYGIYDEASPRHPLATIEAEHPIDALAKYSMSKGYADPRQYEDGQEWFSVSFDGNTRMVYENTGLVAVPTA